MTYGECKNRVLRLIFSKEIAGDDIALDYNCQADYVDMIPSLLDDAQIQIATTVKKIPETVALTDLNGEDKGEYTIYTLPEDCWQMMNGGLVKITGNDAYAVNDRVGDYRLVGKKIFVPKRAGDDLFLEYWRYPRRLGEKPSDAVEMDNTVDAQVCATYYAAAYCVMYDDYFRYSVLKNEYEGQLQRLTMPTFTERHLIHNVYEGFNRLY